MANSSTDAIRDTIQQLHAAMEGLRTNAPEPLAAAVQDYAAAVAEVNGRLRAAHALLRQGRRADAVHACDIEPSVLESVAELDYTDQSLDSWLPTFDELGIPQPQRILTNLAAELNAAYDVSYQLANLMRRHRLLAIGRGPLEDRVDVLRRIIEIDPDNPAWQEDLANYENVCKRALLDELARLGGLPAAAVTQLIVGRIKTLVRQLSSADWLEPLDSAAVRRVQAVLSAVDQARALAELEQVAVQLANAHAAGNLYRVGELGDRWRELTAHATLPPDHRALEGAARALEWFSEERNRAAIEVAEQQAVEDLWRHVHQSLPSTPRAARTAARNLHAALVRIPAPQASHAARTDRDKLHAAVSRKFFELQRVVLWYWGRVVTAAVATIAIVALAAFLVWRDYDRRRVVGDVRKEVVNDLLAREKGKDGRKAWKERVDRHGWLDEHPIAVEIKDKIEKLEQGAELKGKNADFHIEQAKLEVDRYVKPQIEEVEHFDCQAGGINTILDAKQKVESALERARTQLDEADKAIGFVRDQLGDGGADPLLDKHKSARGLLDNSKSHFDGSLKAATCGIKDQLKEDLDALERNPNAPNRRHECERVEQRIDEFEPLDRQAAGSLRARLLKLDDRERENSGTESLVATLDRAARSGLTDYLDAVASPATKPEVRELGDSLARVAADRPAIEAAVTWSALADAWAGDLSCDQATAARWRQALELAMKTNPLPNYGPEEIERLERLLAWFTERGERETRHVERLRETLEAPVMKPGVLMVEVEGKGRYYTRNPEMNDRKFFCTEEKLVRSLETAAKASGPAPQTALATELRHRLDSVTTGKTDYEEGFIDILSLLDGKPPFQNCDPILQCKLIGHVVDALEERALFTDSKPLLKLSDRIAEKVGSAPHWVDPEKRDPEVAKGAKSIINDREKLVAQVVQDYSDRRTALENRPASSRSLVFHGWLDRRAGPEELRLCREGRGADGGLYVVTTGADGFELVAVGRIHDGKHILDATPRLTFGQPVFLSAPTESQLDFK